MKPGEVLLVHGAGGGSGLTGIEVGKAMGAVVIASAGGADKLEAAREAGADHLIDYRKEDLRARVLEITGGRGADVIYDPVGGSAFDVSLRCIAPEGRLIPMGFASGTIPQIPANILLVKNVTVIGFYYGYYNGWGGKTEPTPKEAAALAKRRAMVADAQEELVRWFSAGAELLEEVKTFGGHGASDVLCWPHHFDLGIVIALDPPGAEKQRSIGVGLSPGDHYYPQPYFYVNPYPAQKGAAPQTPLPLGHWHTDGFTGAVALGESIVRGEDGRGDVRQFLRAAFDACCAHLGYVAAEQRQPQQEQQAAEDQPIAEEQHAAAERESTEEPTVAEEQHAAAEQESMEESSPADEQQAAGDPQTTEEQQ